MASMRLPRFEENVLNQLSQMGIAGAILSIFVVPVFLWLLNGVKRREQEQAEQAKKRDDADEKERQIRLEDERKERERRTAQEQRVIEALILSVNKQAESLERWNRFEQEEASIHKQIVSALEKIAERNEETSKTLAAVMRELNAKKQP